jgi:F-type H+-transporting ATPase subunit c
MDPHTITSLGGNIQNMMQGGLGCMGAAIGVALVGSKAVEAVGRNPAAFTQILIMGILGMAFAEAVAFYALFLGK